MRKGKRMQQLPVTGFPTHKSPLSSSFLSSDPHFLSLETFHIHPSFTLISNLLVELPGFDRSVIKAVSYRGNQPPRMSGAQLGKMSLAIKIFREFTKSK